MKLRSHLITLVVVALVPVLVFAGVMIVFTGNEREQALKDNLLEVARALSLAIDRELLASIRTLEALATSQHLDSGELRKFYEQARRVLEADRRWNNMLLVDLSGQQLVNLRRPFGSALPRSGAPENIQQVSETAQPAVSDLFWGYIAQRHLLGVDIPVIRNGKVRYVLTASISPELLTKLLLQQSSSPDWRATVIDREKVIIARTPDVEQFLGKPATALFAAKSDESRETAWRGITHEGIDVYAGLHRSELSGWTVGVALPASLIESRKRNVLAGLVGGGTLLLLVGAALAFVFGRRIAKPIATLTAAAAALGRGEAPPVAVSGVHELDQVAREIESAAANRNRVEEELRNSQAQLRALAAYQEFIREEERKRMARELHDESGQLLASVHISLSEMEGELSGASQRKLAEVRDLLTQIEEHLRNLSHELHPTILDDLGLYSALQSLTEKVSARSRIEINLEGRPNSRLHPTVETSLYRIVQEALNNAVRHGQATTVSVRLYQENGLVHCCIEDNGVGFDVPAALTRTGGESLGLVGIRERVEALGGTLKIRSAPNQGTELCVEIPVERSE